MPAPFDDSKVSSFDEPSESNSTDIPSASGSSPSDDSACADEEGHCLTNSSDSQPDVGSFEESNGTSCENGTSSESDSNPDVGSFEESNSTSSDSNPDVGSFEESNSTSSDSKPDVGSFEESRSDSHPESYEVPSSDGSNSGATNWTEPPVVVNPGNGTGYPGGHESESSPPASMESSSHTPEPFSSSAPSSSFEEPPAPAPEYVRPTPIASEGNFSYGAWGTSWKFISCGGQICAEAFLKYDCASSTVTVWVTPKGSFLLDTAHPNDFFLSADAQSLVLVSGAKFAPNASSWTGDAQLFQGAYDLYVGIRVVGFQAVVVSDNLATLCRPDVAVTMTDLPFNVTRGKSYIVNVTVENVGTTSSVAENVVLRFTSTEGLKLVSHDIPAELLTNNGAASSIIELVVNLGDLPTGVVKRFSIVLSAKLCAGGATVIVHASADCDEPLRNNQHLFLTYFTAPDMTITKTCPATVVAGDVMSYQLTVSNIGSALAGQILVSDDLPAGLEYVSHSGVNGTYDNSSRRVSFNFDAAQAGASLAFLSIQARVLVTEGELVNRASVATASLECNAAEDNNHAECASNVTAPDIAVEKTCPEGDLVAGKSYSYKIEVRNVGSATANNVHIVDQLPEGLVFLSAVPAALSRVGQAVTWSHGSLAVGQVVSITVNVQVNATSGVIVNSVQVNTSSLEGGYELRNNVDECQNQVVAPDVAVSKTCPAELILGAQASYLLTVSNLGGGAAEGVVLRDTLPAGVTFVSVSPAAPVLSRVGQALSWSLGQLNVSGSLTFTVVVDVSGLSAGVSTLSNTVTVTTTSVEGFEGVTNNNYTCSSPLRWPDLAVDKMCPEGSLSAGRQHATYRISVANLGSAPAPNSSLVDTLPAGVAFISANPVPTNVSGQQLTWDLGTLAANGNASISVEVSVNVTAGSLSNSVRVSTTATEGGLGLSNNYDSCSNTVVSPDIAILKTCPPSLTLGTAVNYTLTIRNLGVSSAEDVIVTEELPLGLIFLSAIPAPTTTSPLTWNLGAVNASGSTTITVTARVDGVEEVSEYKNEAFVKTSSIEGYLGVANNNASCSNRLTWTDLAITKLCAPVVTSGNNMVYTLRVVNLGSAPAKEVAVLDTLPSEVEFVSAVPEPDSVAGGSIAWELGTLNPGASVSITITVKVLSSVGQILNYASVDSASVEGGLHLVNNYADCLSTVVYPDIGVNKTCPETLISGEFAEYVIVVSNLGGAALENVVVTDQLDKNLRFDSMVSSGHAAIYNSAANKLTWNLGSIPAASPDGDVVASRVIAELRFKVYVFPIGSDFTSTLWNTVVVNTTTEETADRLENNEDTCVSVLTYPDVEVYKWCPLDYFTTGNLYTYKVDVSNMGTSVAENVVWWDVLPAGVEFVNASLGDKYPATVSGQTVSFHIGSMDPQESLTFELTVRVTTTNDAAPLINRVYINTSSVEAGLREENNVHECNNYVIWPDLAITKSCPLNGSNLNAGKNYEYVVTVKNIGAGAASGVQVVETLPAGVAFLSATVAPATIAGQVLTWNLGNMASQASVTITLSVGVSAVSGQLTNRVLVNTSSIEGGLQASNNNAHCSNNVVSADVSLDKQCSSMFILGSTQNYTITVRNEGGAHAEDVIVKDNMPAGTTVVGTWPAPTTISPLTWNLGMLAPGATSVIVISVVVSGDGAVGSEGGAAPRFVNFATVSTTSLEGLRGTSNNDDNCTNVLTWADVSITKACPAGDLTSGNQATYNIRVKNLGTAPANGLVVTDQLPSQVVFVSAVPAPASVSGQTLSWNVSSLGVGAELSYAVVVRVVAAEGQVTNLARVEVTGTVEGGQGESNNMDSCFNKVISSDIAVEKECPAQMVLGDRASYAVTVRNLGASAANNVIVVDTLPEGLAFQSMMAGGVAPSRVDAAARTLTWNLGTVAPAAVVTLRFNVTVVGLGAEDFGASVVNRVVVNTSSTEIPGGDSNNQAACSSRPVWPDIDVRKACPPGSLVSGKQYSFTLNITNIGTSVAHNVVLIDALPQGVVFFSASPATPAPTLSGNNVSWAIGELAPSQGFTFTVIVNVTSTGSPASLVNHAGGLTSSLEGGYRLLNNYAECQNNITWADLAVDKVCPAQNIIAGREATYQIHVSNLGSASALDSFLVDTLPAGLTFVSSSVNPASVVGNVVTWNLGALASGANMTISITVSIQSTAGTLNNVVRVNTSTFEGGRGLTNNQDACSNVVGSADVSIVKQCPLDMILGSSRNYTVTVRNVGTAVASNVVVRDDLPAGMTYVAASPAPASVAGSSLSWNLGDMAPGASVVLSINVRAAGVKGVARYTNVAYVSTTSVEGFQGTTNNQNQCENVVTYPDLAVTKKCPDYQLVFNGEADYVIEVRNLGTAVALNVTLVDTMPAKVNFTQAFPPHKSLGAGGLVNWNLGDMAPGATISIHVIARVIAVEGEAINRVSVSTISIEGGLGAENNVDQCSNNVAATDIAVVKTCPNATSAGGQATYVITVTNLGAVAAQGVMVRDSLPAGVLFMSSDRAGAAYDSASRVVSWSLGTVAVGQSLTFTAVVFVAGPQVYPAGSAPLLLENNVAVNTTTAEVAGGEVNNHFKCSSPFHWPDVSVDKTCPPTSMALGGVYLYTIEVGNVGNGVAEGVVLVDQLPPGVAFVSTDDGSEYTITEPGFDPYAASGQTLTYKLGKVVPGAKILVSVHVKVLAAYGNLTNIARVTTTSPEGGLKESNNYDSCSNDVVAPQVEIVGVCPDYDLLPGASTSYVITVRNNGGAPAVNVTLSATVPAPLKINSVDASPATQTITGNVISLFYASIPAGTSYTVTVSATVDIPENTCSSVLYSNFTISSKNSAVVFGNNTRVLCQQRVTFVDVSIAKSCAVQLSAGGVSVYTLTARNLGCGVASGVVVKDTLPDGLVFKSSTGPITPTVDDTLITYTIGEMGPNSVMTFVLTTDVNAYLGNVTNVVVISTTSTESGLGAANNRAECMSSVDYADIELNKDCPSVFVFPNRGVYTLTIRNRGTRPAENVFINDTLSKDVFFSSLAPLDTTYTTHDNMKVIYITVGTLAPMQTKVYTITAGLRSNVTGLVVNSAFAITSSIEYDTVEDNNFASCENAVTLPSYQRTP